ncbi:hypothetical protein MRB53_031972 [Persea americana]|uniref:Uncharacterized protein n=1 Tax=Persea americana TaxID=3435 RepID=A0ACC2KR51_PERAE|nr:hypothetical protein MRB53_031972 [Persea americana]
MGGGEALVVEEEGLDVVVLGVEAIFKDLGGVRKRVRVLEEGGMGKDRGFVLPNSCGEDGFQHKGTLYGLSPPQGRPDPLIGWPGSMGIWAPTLSPKCVLSNACRPISHVIPEASKQL